MQNKTTGKYTVISLSKKLLRKSLLTVRQNTFTFTLQTIYTIKTTKCICILDSGLLEQLIFLTIFNKTGNCGITYPHLMKSSLFKSDDNTDVCKNVSF